MFDFNIWSSDRLVNFGALHYPLSETVQRKNIKFLFGMGLWFFTPEQCDVITVKKTCINGRVHFFKWRSNILNLVDFVSRQLLSFRLYSRHFFFSFTCMFFFKFCTGNVFQTIIQHFCKQKLAAQFTYMSKFKGWLCVDS